MKKTNEKLSEVLDVEPMYAPVMQPVVISIEEENKTSVEDDAEFARQNIRSLIEKGNVAIDNLLNVAHQSDHPRAYEVAANMLKSLTDMNKDLMEIQKRKKDLEPKETNNASINVDKAVFIGSTKELIKALKSKE
jgi:predicted NodU family carbamoyl transferase